MNKFIFPSHEANKLFKEIIKIHKEEVIPIYQREAEAAGKLKKKARKDIQSIEDALGFY